MKKDNLFEDFNKVLNALLYDPLDGEIEMLKIDLATANSPEEIKQLQTDLAKAIALRNEELKHKVKPIDVFKSVVNAGGLILTLGFEHTGLIASKVWGITSKAFFRNSK